MLVEVISGEGGTDAKNFAQELFTAYLTYLERNGIAAELEETGPSKWSFLLRDSRANALFDTEVGGHCIQRIPNNSKGRKHTSYVTVVVSQLKNYSIILAESDLEESFQRGSQGAGGQNVNKVNSAVRLRHKPTGLEVLINGRDQGRNRQVARQALAGKLENWNKSQQGRASYTGAGRGGKIRTYNLQDSRVTDHRTGAKCHRPDLILKEGRFELLR